MAHAEKSVVIHRPVRSVFEFVLNGANNKLWRSSVLEVRPESEAPYGAGAKFRQVLKGPTGRTAGDYEITECEPNELISFRATAGATEYTGSYRFRAEGAATVLTFILDHGRKRLSKASEHTIQQWIEEEAGMLDELKAFLEKHV